MLPTNSTPAGRAAPRGDTTVIVTYPFLFRGVSDGGAPPPRDDLLAEESVRAVADRYVSAVARCYRMALDYDAGLRGQVVIRFTVAPSGRVIRSLVERSTLRHPPAVQCIADLALGWSFPPRPGARDTTISYTFELVR